MVRKDCLDWIESTFQLQLNYFVIDFAIKLVRCPNFVLGSRPSLTNRPSG